MLLPFLMVNKDFHFHNLTAMSTFDKSLKNNLTIPVDRARGTLDGLLQFDVLTCLYHVLDKQHEESPHWRWHRP